MKNREKNADLITFKETGSLDGFTGFDNEISQVDNSFWDDDTDESNTEPDKVMKDAMADDIEQEETPKTTEELKEELFPGDIADDTDDEQEYEETVEEVDTDVQNGVKAVKPKVDKLNSISLLESLKERGLADYELEDDEEMTEELAESLIEESFEAGVENRIKELFEDFPPIVQQFNKYVIDGGDPSNFFKHVNNSQKLGITSDIDLTDEKNQEKVVRQLMREEGEDEELIEAQIEFYKDSGKLSSIANRKFEKWNTKRKQEEQKMLEQQAQQRVINKQKLREYKQNLSSNIPNLNLGEIKLSRKDTKELPSYIVDKTIKLQNGSNISQRDADLYDVLDNEKASVQLAYLLRNRNSDGTFNFKNIEKTINTKITKEVKNNIRRNSKLTPSTSIYSGSSQKRELYDYF